jgi:mycoredoxin-dependent peroxiredoxin
MQRLTAFEAKLPQYRSQNVQVLGISVDDPLEAARWASDIGVSFPLLADKEGEIAKQFGLFDSETTRAAKAVAVVYDGRLVYSQEVSTPEIPPRLTPWIDNLLSGE